MEKEKKKSKKPLFGEVLLQSGLITQTQLIDAVKRQGQVGGHIGSILKEMGYLDDDFLLRFLSKQFGVPPVNLFETEIATDVLNLLPFEKVKSLNVLPLNVVGPKVSLAMVNPKDMSVIQAVEFALGRIIEPFVVPYYQLDRAIGLFEREGYGDKPFESKRLKPEIPTVEYKTPSIYDLLRLVPDYKATDLHLTAGAPPSVRINNEIKRLSMPTVTPQQIEEFAYGILTKEQRGVFDRKKEIDFSVSLPNADRYRINIYKQRNSISLTARLIIENIPSLKGLGLPEWLSDFALKTQGFILITGTSGQGKTSTMSALIDIINSNRKCNIVTLEDPIEYLHKHKKSNVNQREVGVDTESFSAGLKHIFRQDPDVIVIGEMRDPESIAIALTAAAGHLVISTLHSLNATTAVDRIVDIFPAQQHQVRMQFADVFLIIFAQRLVPKKEGEGRIPAYEWITNTFRVRNMIRKGKTHNVRSFMQTAAEDMSSIDQSLARLYLEGKITLEDGMKFADNPQYYKGMVESRSIGIKP